MFINDDLIDDIDLMEFAGLSEAAHLRWASDWANDLAELCQNGSQIQGAKLPWDKTHDKFRMRPGELVIWAGMSGHKKSMLTSQVALHLAQTERVCIASLEMTPATTLHRMYLQASNGTGSPETSRIFSNWAHEKICIYDQVDTVPAERILGLIHYAAEALGCKHVFIDSLTKCGIPSGESKMEKVFIDRLTWVAKTLGICVHLVAHVRKPHGGEEVKPNKFDVRGASEMTDLASSVILCWANKAKAQLLEDEQLGKRLDDVEHEAVLRPCQELTIAKQRNGEFEGIIGLYFDATSLQFREADAPQDCGVNFYPEGW